MIYSRSIRWCEVVIVTDAVIIFLGQDLCLYRWLTTLTFKLNIICGVPNPNGCCLFHCHTEVWPHKTCGWCRTCLMYTCSLRLAWSTWRAARQLRPYSETLSQSDSYGGGTCQDWQTWLTCTDSLLASPLVLTSQHSMTQANWIIWCFKLCVKRDSVDRRIQVYPTCDLWAARDWG